MGLKSKQVSINEDEDEDEDEEQGKNQKKNEREQAEECPRCRSMNTKFCYYNNYNKFQPRYFCKACKRYWTKGGTLRNVPLGCGRKNKRLKTVALLNSPKTITISTVPLPTSTTAPDPDHQHYCNIYNLHLSPAQQGLKAVSELDNDEKKISESEYLFDTFSVDTISPEEDVSHNLSFSGGCDYGNLSPITPGMYDCSSSQQLENMNIISTSCCSSITENYSRGLQDGNDDEWVNGWNMNDLDTLISVDDLNYLPWAWDDDNAPKQINPLNELYDDLDTSRLSH